MLEVEGVFTEILEVESEILRSYKENVQEKALKAAIFAAARLKSFSIGHKKILLFRTICTAFSKTANP
jgi:hypothetical protein